jgi:hypothetical protein
VPIAIVPVHHRARLPCVSRRAHPGCACDNTQSETNYHGLATQRTAALRYAREQGFDVVWFVDSDTRIRSGTLRHLQLGILLGAEIVTVPYGMRWNNNEPVLGYLDPGSQGARAARPPSFSLVPYHTCLVTGMGCTALSVRSARLPESFHCIETDRWWGEDIGFCLAAHRKGCRTWATNWAPRPLHHTHGN